MKKLKLDIKSESKGPAKSKHPVVKADVSTMQLLEQFEDVNPKFKDLKDQNETLSRQLATHIKALYFKHFAGVAADSTMLVKLASGKFVKLITTKKYSKKLEEESSLVSALGKTLVDKYFKQSTILKLDIDKVPESKQEAFASAVIDLANKMDVSEAVTAAQCFQPVEGFHDVRTTVLTEEQNLELDRVLGVVAYPQL
jgi:hypothetical protein